MHARTVTSWSRRFGREMCGNDGLWLRLTIFSLSANSSEKHLKSKKENNESRLSTVCERASGKSKTNLMFWFHLACSRRIWIVIIVCIVHLECCKRCVYCRICQRGAFAIFAFVPPRWREFLSLFLLLILLIVKMNEIIFGLPSLLMQSEQRCSLHCV